MFFDFLTTWPITSEQWIIIIARYLVQSVDFLPWIWIMTDHCLYQLLGTWSIFFNNRLYHKEQTNSIYLHFCTWMKPHLQCKFTFLHVIGSYHAHTPLTHVTNKQEALSILAGVHCYMTFTFLFLREFYLVFPYVTIPTLWMSKWM
jgi:hypothetical protein